MSKTLRDIIKTSNDLYEIKVHKPSGNERHNRSTWRYEMVDSRWSDESFRNYKLKPVFLRRDNCFFLAYKSDDTNAYFVDVSKALYRKSINTYVKSLVDYSVCSNDISTTKDEPSFRVTQGEMKHNRIDNFLDLCYTYRNFSAIGTGYTRNIRNLIVLDIDVDCTRPENREDINNLLISFSKYDSLPDFYVFNHNSKHIQLQWLIQDLLYKDIDNDTTNTVINELTNDTYKNREIDFRKTDFTKISQKGIQYRRYTLALCDIVKRRKFGDKNYTFWKAKNPMSALIGAYNLELLMPYCENGEIKYRSDEEMNLLFASKESRRRYFENAPTMEQWYSKISEMMDPLVEKITEKKAMKNDDATDVTVKKTDTTPKQKKQVSYGASRNTFVLTCTRYTTPIIARNYGCRHREDFNKLTHEQFNMLKKEVFGIVQQRFKEEDMKYGGVWPDTTNMSSFTYDEFKKAFDSSFNYTIQNINNCVYSDDDRKKSIQARINTKNIKLIIVDRIKNSNTKITRKELLREVNDSLKRLFIRKISMGSLKRYIAESNELTDERRSLLMDNLHKRNEMTHKYLDG